jgi:hypothetical protein
VAGVRVKPSAVAAKPSPAGISIPPWSMPSIEGEDTDGEDVVEGALIPDMS